MIRVRHFTSLLLALLIVISTFSPAFAYAAETTEGTVTTAESEAGENTIQQTEGALTPTGTASEPSQTENEVTDPVGEPTK